ncbi:MAG: cupin domain-containing protein [bacterium]|nr:cupin domain-containing protein [bacterium]
MDKNTGIYGKSALLEELLDYQGGAIVSKELLKKESGTVTMFAFDQGQGLSEHTAPFDALVNIVDGEAQVKIAGELFILKKGEVIIMPANKPHSVQAEKQFKMLLTLIKASD